MPWAHLCGGTSLRFREVELHDNQRLVPRQPSVDTNTRRTSDRTSLLTERRPSWALDVEHRASADHGHDGKVPGLTLDQRTDGSEGAAGPRWDAANGDAAQGVPQLDPFRRFEQRDLDLPADPTTGHQDRLIVSAYLNLGGDRLRIARIGRRRESNSVGRAALRMSRRRASRSQQCRSCRRVAGSP